MEINKNMISTHPKVDEFFQKDKKWIEPLKLLRKYCLESDLKEEFKWYQPCYVYKNKNIIILGELNDHCVFSFFNGHSLRDPKNLLEAPGPNTRFARVIRFYDLEKAIKLEKEIKALIKEAKSIEEKERVNPQKEKIEVETPTELLDEFKKDRELKKAFYQLTPGRQRGYLLFLNNAKQSSTRQNRIKQYRPKIMAGKGYQE